MGTSAVCHHRKCIVSFSFYWTFKKFTADATKHFTETIKKRNSKFIYSYKHEVTCVLSIWEFLFSPWKCIANWWGNVVLRMNMGRGPFLWEAERFPLLWREEGRYYPLASDAAQRFHVDDGGRAEGPSGTVKNIAAQQVNASFWDGYLPSTPMD